MTLRTLIVLAALALTSVGAGSIGHDEVQPFPQPEPTTDVQKAAVTFKPSLFIESGCRPYPAVNAAGETSGGLKGSGSPDGECKGSGWGSQVYSRSVLYSGKWAILYAWYFPKDVSQKLFITSGARHRWLHAVVWIDDVALDSPTVLAIATPKGIEKPVDRAHINGPTTKFAVTEDFHLGAHYLVPTTESGEFQDLIQWDQMTEEARDALAVADFGENNAVPFTDAYFDANIKAAATHKTYERISRFNYNTTEHALWGYTGIVDTI